MINQMDDVTNWLTEHFNQTLQIEKQEHSDLDVVHLSLKDAAYQDTQASRLDDYMTGCSLVLMGEGSILSAAGNQPLPQHSFVIPLEGLSDAKVTDDAIELQTDRALYTMSVV